MKNIIYNSRTKETVVQEVEDIQDNNQEAIVLQPTEEERLKALEDAILFLMSNGGI